MFQSTRPPGARPRPPASCSQPQPFQSARPRGAGLAALNGAIYATTFQSTRPHRARRSTTARAWAAGVSIRAPARGAIPVRTMMEQAIAFQSARPRGARCFHFFHAVERGGFNPRARAGRDPMCVDPYRVHGVSIRAPARGAIQCASTPTACTEFQSARPRGARSNVRRPLPRARSFNPRARAGRDEGWYHVHLRPASFNPRARAGRDPS